MTDEVTPQTPFFDGPARWLLNPDEQTLDGFAQITWPWLRKGWVAEAHKVGVHRSSLANAASEWLAWLGKVDRLAVVDVHLDGAEAAAEILGFAVEPARRRGIELIVGADHTLEELEEAAFFEPDFGYAYSLERLRWRLRAQQGTGGRPATLPETDFRPDPTQAQAVGAGSGVIQVIAPAGSGKTTVLVERVRELRRRAVPAKRIACVTFNRAAAEELKERLLGAGVGDVRAMTFHGLGYRLLVEAHVLPAEPRIGAPTLGQWRMLAMTAKKQAGEDGVWLDPAHAKSALSNIKLGLLMTAEQYADSIGATEDAEARTLAALYKAHEALQRERKQVDYDDLILKAVLLLRQDAETRAIWQARLHYLLVDEYQDIEPAQELLIRMIAAPHDELFCVGDEDQTLYAFRRASVERIIRLDGLYPGLERVALGVNYRCAPSIVAASRTLIAVNRVRFPKRIEPDPEREQPGTIELQPVVKAADAADRVAQTLARHARGEVVVLARTTNSLRPVALACAARGVAIDGADRLFEPVGARRALEAHLHLAVAPQQADARLIQRVCQEPGRGLRSGAQAVATRLQAGASFADAFQGVEAPKRGGGKLLAPGELFTQLAACSDATAAVTLLRGPGGLDDWFEDEDRMGGLDQFEGEVLEQAERDAARLTPREYLDDLVSQAKKLKAMRDKQNGIELSTIHGAKGRQWPRVVVVSCEERVLPHARSLEVGAEEAARGEGIEAERRLAYVAFTRAQERLELQYDKERPSRFLRDAQLIAGTAGQRRTARNAPPAPQPPGSRGPSAKPGLGRLLRRRG
ncbi:MAG TPA: ATP-dependent helicase [Solirubrobacteraceae bacterium]|jgi:superfamily I DNA/RNA helicase|nr:ATP-dependent helicase [Solirubrobacteraceae bacterium]